MLKMGALTRVLVHRITTWNDAWRQSGFVQERTHRIAAHDWREGLARAGLIEADELPATQSPFEAGTLRRRGDFPRGAHDEGLRDVEIRKSPGRPLIEEQLVEQAVGIRIIGLGRGERVDALAKGVGNMKLDAVADTLRQIRLHRVVERIRLPQRPVDAAEVRIQFCVRHGRGLVPLGRKPTAQEWPLPSGPQGHK